MLKNKVQNTILIPAYQPGSGLPRLVRDLYDLGFRHILVVDDGSGEEYQSLFAISTAWGATVVHHDENLGKGAALKTGIAKMRELFPADPGIITADADGQHLPGDIEKVSRALNAYPDHLILGVRDFSKENVPWKSRFGNRITRAFFRLSTGKPVSDTQTGLRGFSTALSDKLLSIEGDRYEYEMHMLEDLVDSVPVKEIPIETVYEDNNAGSHFRPVVDSARVYGRPLKFVTSSLTSSVLDLLLFWALLLVLPASEAAMITVATVVARCFSGIVNYLLNRYWCFHSKGSALSSSIKYGILFVVQMGLSAALVSLLSLVLSTTVIAKMIVDTMLFFLSYQVQKHWVFRKKEVHHGECVQPKVES